MVSQSVQCLHAAKGCSQQLCLQTIFLWCKFCKTLNQNAGLHHQCNKETVLSHWRENRNSIRNLIKNELNVHTSSNSDGESSKYKKLKFIFKETLTNHTSSYSGGGSSSFGPFVPKISSSLMTCKRYNWLGGYCIWRCYWWEML